MTLMVMVIVMLMVMVIAMVNDKKYLIMKA